MAALTMTASDPKNRFCQPADVCKKPKTAPVLCTKVKFKNGKIFNGSPGIKCASTQSLESLSPNRMSTDNPNQLTPEEAIRLNIISDLTLACHIQHATST